MLGHFLRIQMKKKKKKKNFISITCYISSAYILKYMLQSVIERKDQKTNMSVYDIPL